VETNKFQSFFKGYIQAVLTSLCSFSIIFILSFASLKWFFLEIFFSFFVAFILHFLFLLGMYLIVLPLISYLDLSGEKLAVRKLMDRYIPLFTIPFAFLIGLIWFTGWSNRFFTFVLFDMLFTCYIGLYYYLKNRCKINETA
jgi:hypothetical protein